MKRILFLALFGLTLSSQIRTSQALTHTPAKIIPMMYFYNAADLHNLPILDQISYQTLFLEFTTIQKNIKTNSMSLSDGLYQLQQLKKECHSHLADKKSQTKIQKPIDHIIAWYAQQLL